MSESAADLLRRLKPKYRRVTLSGHTAPEAEAKPAAKTTAKPKAAE
jgi:hypothetical protein